MVLPRSDLSFLSFDFKLEGWLRVPFFKFFFFIWRAEVKWGQGRGGQNLVTTSDCRRCVSAG